MQQNDYSRLSNDLVTILGTIIPEMDYAKVTERVGEVLSNYDISRKTVTSIENDIPEKVALFISALSIDGFSATTIADYKGELRRFSGMFSIAVSQIKTIHIREYLASFEDIQVSTRSKKLSVLKSFFKWLVDEELILRNPTSKIKTPKKPKRLAKGLNIGELEVVRESCTSLRQRALIEVMYSTAVRLSELVSLNVSDIDFQDMSAKVIGKGNKERVVFLSHRALYHLQSYLSERGSDGCDALFVTERKPTRRMGNRAIQREIGKIEEASGIESKLTPHLLRHTFANLSMGQGVELSDLQHLLGHSDPATTLIYAPVSEERKRAAHKRFHVQ